MGTDIHLYVERRVNGAWVPCDTWEDDIYEPGAKTVPYGKRFYNDRCYDLFGILANVRNGSGFAGCDTGDGFIPICEPRGLPDDLSQEICAGASDFIHTPSWLTLRELLDYDWTRTTNKRGWVNGPEYNDWVGCGGRSRDEGPKSWRGGIMGRDVEHITEQEMERRLQNILDQFKGDRDCIGTAIKDLLGNKFCKVSWQIPYYRAAAGFLSETMPRLWRLGAPEDVRIVFWFDS